MMPRQGGSLRPRPILAGAVRLGLTLGLGLGLGLGLTGCAPPDTGRTAPVLELLSPPILTGWGETADPALAVDPETGDLVFAWGGTEDGESWNLYLSRSGDGGDHFAPAVRVNHLPGALHPHAEGAPRLVAAPGVLALFWNNRLIVEGRRFASSDLLFARSLDGGRTWSSAVTVQDPPVPADLPPRAHTFHGAAWAGDSVLVVAWLDGRDRDARRLARATALGIAEAEAARTPEAFQDDADPHDGDATVYAAISHDLGATWSTPNRRILGGICPCCRVTLVRTAEGGLVGGWRQHFEGEIRDLALRTVFDPRDPYDTAEGGGVRWTRVHDDGWQIAGCPHSGPGMSTGPDGRIHVTWYTGAEGATGIHYRTLTADLEPTGSDPLPLLTGEGVGVANPAVVALADGGAVVAANVAADGRRVISLLGISPTGGRTFSLEVPDSEGGTHPQLVSVGGDRVLLAWTESRGGIQRVRLARLRLTPQREAPTRAAGRDLAPVPGNPAPAWTGTTLGGEAVSLDRYRGQVVLLNIWATWCTPCIREMPGLQALHDHFAGQGVTVVGASVDRRSAHGEVARFTEELGITFPILLDPDQTVMSRFRTIGVPETFLIDADGILRHRWIGEFDPMEPDVLNRVEYWVPGPAHHPSALHSEHSTGG
jgi:peroxiredoxin